MADIWSWVQTPEFLVLVGFHVFIVVMLALDLGLFQRVNNPTRDPGQPGLTHIAWQFDSPADLEAVAARLKEDGIEAEAVRRGASLERLYLRDPDGNRVELYCGDWDAGLAAMLEKAHG